jgi:hypothetical protein
MTTINGLKELRGEFVRLASEEEATSSRALLRHRGGYFAAALLVCVAVIGAIVVAIGDKGESRVAGSARHGAGAQHGVGSVHGSVPNAPNTTSQRGIVGPWSPYYPISGRRVSLKAAGTALGVAIPVAQDQLANESRMGSITLATLGRLNGVRDTVVAISYPTSQIAIEYETPVPYPDPLANYEAYVAEDQQAPLLHHLAFVGSVAGRPALVIRLDADSSRANPASVEFVLNHTRIAVIGY